MRCARRSPHRGESHTIGIVAQGQQLGAIGLQPRRLGRNAMRSAGIACLVANSHTISSGSQLATIGAIRLQPMGD
jgi:hypothetical protein